MTIKKTQFLIITNAFLCFFLLPCNAITGEQSNSSRSIYKTFRSLSQEQLQEASDARDTADLMLSDYRKIYTIMPSKESGKRPSTITYVQSEQEIRDYNKVISTYREIIDKYEGTEIAAYCQIRICATYEHLGQYQEAIRQAEITSQKYSGTSYEPMAYLYIGNLYLQSIKDPNTAIKWFEKIPKPDNENLDGTVPREKYDEANMNYVSAQNKIATCEIKLGKAQDAIKRYEELSQRYPQYKDVFERHKKTELNINMEERLGINYEHTLDSAYLSADLLGKPTDAAANDSQKKIIPPASNNAITQKNEEKNDIFEPNSSNLLAQYQTANKSRNRIFIVVIIAIFFFSAYSVYFRISNKYKNKF
jgi:tetratricopeptide (TPR) repeat protein